MSTTSDPDRGGGRVHSTAAAGRADGPRNPVGRAALVVAAILVTVEVVQQVLAVLAPMIVARQGLSVSAYSVLLVPGNVVIGLLAVAAVILGILGLVRPASPRGAAAAGLAIGAQALLALLIGPLAGLMVSFI